MRSFTVAIAGGGASGTLTASALVERSNAANVIVIDPCERLGRGVAYTTDCPTHVLNVPAANMSAVASEPDHFVRWLAANEKPYGPTSFVPRSVYGDYLSELATAAQKSAPDRLSHVRALAVEVRQEGDGIHVACSNGETIRADALVVASGNASPAAWPNVSTEMRRSHRYFNSAWEPRALVPDSPDETVVLLGMGLTAIDAIFGLRHNGHRGTIYMVSRRGLSPQEHRAVDKRPFTHLDARTLSALVGTVRMRVRDVQRSGGDWRTVIDDMRPKANVLWKALPLEEQRRFFRHVLAHWNVHRHRIAAGPAKDIADLIASGTLRSVAGRTGDITASGGITHVPIKVRGSNEIRTVDAGRIVNCSGPQLDVRRLSNPLIKSLLERGLMVPNQLGVGVRVAESGALIGADDVPSSRLFAIGPARFGALIETTAMPEIREQVRELAGLLSGAFVPEGERLAR